MRFEETSLEEREKEEFIQKIQAFLSACPGGPVVIKDFQINELMPFWSEAAARNGFCVKVVIAVRHPHEVFASAKAGANFLQREDASSENSPPSISIEKFNTFWLKVNLHAERHSRAVPRVVVEYSSLMKNWRAEVTRMG